MSSGRTRPDSGRSTLWRRVWSWLKCWRPEARPSLSWAGLGAVALISLGLFIFGKLYRIW
jgi:hypothetical protein